MTFVSQNMSYQITVGLVGLRYRSDKCNNNLVLKLTLRLNPNPVLSFPSSLTQNTISKLNFNQSFECNSYVLLLKVENLFSQLKRSGMN